MKLRLNLATVPQENNRPFLAGAGLVFLVGFVFFIFLSHSAYASWSASRTLRAEIGHWQDQIRSDRAQRQQLSNYFHSPAAQNILDRSAFLNSLIDERSFPWTKIFVDLEQTLPPGVRVVSIAPKLVNGRAEVTLTIGAETDESKIQFLEAIEKSNVFSGMTVTDEKRYPEPQASDKIVLNLKVWYSTT
jgi:hypothetical protein